MLNQDFNLGLIAPFFQLIVIGLLIYRRVGWRFRFFFGYTVYSSVLASAVRAATIGSSETFFKLYWATEAVYGLLALLVVVPIYRRAHRFLAGKYRWFPLALGGTVLAMASVSVWWAVYHPMGHTPLFRLETGTIAFMMDVRLLEAGMFFLCLVIKLDKTNPVDWRRYDFGILMGFGVSAFLTLVAYLPHLIFSRQFEASFRYSPTSVYIAISVFWVTVFLREEPALKLPDLPEVQQRLERIEQQREVLRKIRKWKGPRYADARLRSPVVKAPIVEYGPGSQTRWLSSQITNLAARHVVLISTRLLQSNRHIIRL